MENPEFVAMDTIEYFIKNDFDGVKRVLAQVGCAILNDAEARMLTRRQNLVAAGGELLRMGPSMAVIKKGEHGSILFLQDGTVSPYPAFPLESVVDPTGAGDAFAGGFVGFLSRAGSVRRESLRKAMAWGTVAGSITVESFGTKPLMEATFETALERYEKYRALMHYEEEK
jgi:sugar/nucleoside kinase (ribokinase family)